MNLLWVGRERLSEGSDELWGNVLVDTNKKPRHNNNWEHMETVLGSN